MVKCIVGGSGQVRREEGGQYQGTQGYSSPKEPTQGWKFAALAHKYVGAQAQKLNYCPEWFTGVGYNIIPYI